MSDEVITNQVEESQVAPEAPVNNPEEQAAIERFRQSQLTKEERESGMPEGYNEDGTEREELIAGKFKSQEDLLKAYQELEKKLGQPKEEAPKAPEKASEEVSDAPSEPSAIQVSKYEQEFVDNGTLSDDSYKELEKLGFNKNQVDQYIQGQQVYAENVRNSIYNSVGGQEEYSAVIQWASENLDSGLIQDYNQAVDSLDQTKILRNLEYMKMKRDQSAPQQARRLEGDSPASGIQPYSNKNEWQRDQTNRLYGKDPKYTNMVDTRYLAARKRGIL